MNQNSTSPDRMAKMTEGDPEPLNISLASSNGEGSASVLDDYGQDEASLLQRNMDDSLVPAYTEQGMNKLGRPKGWGKRHTFAILSFYGVSCTYAMRFNLTIALVAMIKRNDNSDENGTSYVEAGEEYCSFSDHDTTSSRRKTYGEGEFDWDERTQGVILGSFFWGYISTQLLGGWAASTFGGKWPMAIGVGLSGFMCYLTPVLARTNVGMLLFCRIIQGLSQGVIFPSIQQLLASWSPPSQRSFFTAVAYSGCQVGAGLIMISSGYLIKTGWEWPWIFYFTGGATTIWFILWIIFVSSTPAEDSRISESEREYIMASIGSNLSAGYRKVPWLSIFTSWPVWVVAICDFSHGWGMYTLLMELPSYLKSVLQFDVEANSWISAAPELAMWFFSFLITFVADRCISRKLVKTIHVRKACHTISEVGAGLGLIGAAYIGCDRVGAVILLTVSAGLSGAACGSFIPNQVEIAHNFAGAIMGLTNTIGNLAGFAVPIVSGELINGHANDPIRWRYVFLIAAAIYMFSAVLFVSCATSEEQPWNWSTRKSKSTYLEILGDNGENRNQQGMRKEMENSFKGKSSDSNDGKTVTNGKGNF